jgi:hypothetical protein
MANQYSIARLTEAQERNLWNKWIKPIVELHYNGAIEYKFFTDPEIITQDDIISLWKFTLASFFYRTTSPGILSTQTSDERLIDLFNNPWSTCHLLSKALIPLKAGMKDNLVTPFFNLLLGIFENGKLPVFLAYLDQAASSYDTKQNHFAISVSDDIQWEQIKFQYFNDDIIQVFYPGGAGPLSSNALGLANKPSLFALFKLFAKLKGAILPKQGMQNTKANVSNLRKLLKSLFPGIPGKPIKDYNKREGWECNFKISHSASDYGLDSTPEPQSDVKDIFEESRKRPAKSKFTSESDY